MEVPRIKVSVSLVVAEGCGFLPLGKVQSMFSPTLNEILTPSVFLRLWEPCLSLILDVGYVTRAFVNEIVDGLASAVGKLDVVFSFGVETGAALAVSEVVAVLVANRVAEVVFCGFLQE